MLSRFAVALPVSLTRQASPSQAWTKWFDGMGQAAEKHGVRMMYCMAPAGVLLHSVTLAASEVTRSSGDYIVGHRETPRFC